MRKFLLLLFFSTIYLFSNILCRQKLAKELVLLPDNYPSWVVGKEESIAFSPFLLKDVNVTKRNPLLGLYLIHHSSPLKEKEPITIRPPKTVRRYAMSDEVYISGKVVQPQLGLSFGKFSQYIPDNLSIVSGCCVTAGISIGGDRFINGAYIRWFINSPDGHLSDVGARFIEKNGSIYVSEVNPFFTDNPFLEGDEILYLNDEPVENLEKFLQHILFTPVGKILRFEVLRNSDIVELSVRTDILRGGGLFSDTFLENIGVWLDENLFVTNLHPKSNLVKHGLKIGYRLVSINGKKFANETEIRKYLSSIKDNIPVKFTFVFQNRKLGNFVIELKSNRKYFKHINAPYWEFGYSNTNWYWYDSEIDSKNSTDPLYEIYNKLPLTKYLL